jgi:hypothetical protein
LKKKFGPFEISTEDDKNIDLAPDMVFFDQLIRMLGVLLIIDLACSSITHDEVKLYHPIVGALLLAAIIYYLVKKIRTTTKRDVVQFTNRFVRIERKKKDNG